MPKVHVTINVKANYQISVSLIALFEEVQFSPRGHSQPECIAHGAGKTAIFLGLDLAMIKIDICWHALFDVS